MGHHAPLTGAAGEAWPEDDGPRASVRARGRVLPPALREQRDHLFRDADQHGPRRPALVRRSLPALVLLPATLLLSAALPWRSLVLDAASAPVADLVLVAPVLASIVVLATAIAPLARMRVEPLLGAGLLLLGITVWLASSGLLVAATAPGTIATLLLGIAGARAVRRAVWTLPMLMAAGISDAQSVEFGITRRLLEGVGVRGGEQVAPVLSVPPDVVAGIDLLVIHVPAATGTWMLGLVDVLAIGLLLGLAHLFWLPLGRTALAISGVLVLTVGLGVALPVLPMLGVAWLLVHARLVWRSTRFSLRRLTYLGG